MSKSMTTDTYTTTYHGFAVSHIDTMCHFPYKNQTWNGYSVNDILSDSGCRKMGIQTLKDGVVTRGVLIDIPRLKGVPYLEPGTPVYVEDIEAWEKKANVKLGAGDAILLRTGRWARRAKVGSWNPQQTGFAGYHASVIPWIKSRDIALVGGDGPQDVQPSMVEGIQYPVHMLLLDALGVNLLDSHDFEALAETCARLNRWEFMIVTAPLAIPNGTGSPVNTIAIF
jgi:kynurenine formamidase